MLRLISPFFIAILFFFSQSVAWTSVSKEEFDEVIRRMEEIFAPKALDRGRSLRITSLWDHHHEGAIYVDGTSSNTKWQIYIYNGGYTKTFSETMTIDAAALLVCHELGHYFGGHPRRAPYILAQFQIDQGMKPWPPTSSEGQADYFATWKCLKEYFKRDDNVGITALTEVPSIVQNKCREIYPNVQESSLCLRINRAALSYVQTLAAKRKRQGRDSTAVSFDTPSPHIVSKTVINNYPDLQCRLDTFFQGSLCYDEHPCENKIGTRPQCWYVATQTNE